MKHSAQVKLALRVTLVLTKASITGAHQILETFISRRLRRPVHKRELEYTWNR